MTEEELEQQAEEYAKREFKTIGNFLIPDDIAKIYKDGYEQGQKDKLTEKEKLELKDLLNRSNIRLAEEQIKNNELKEEIKLIESVTDANADKVEELKKQNEELKEQIEKMKCCGNCLFYDGCSSCIVQGCVNNNKWELAE